MHYPHFPTSFIARWLIAASLCFCPWAQAADSTDADSTDIERLNQKVASLRQAMIDGDAKTLRALSSTQLSYGHSSGVMEDQEAFIEKLSSGKSDFVTMELSDQSIRISGDTALVRHRLTADIKDGGVPNSIQLGVLLVWQKQSGEWKLLARQAFKLPPTTSSSASSQ